MSLRRNVGRSCIIALPPDLRFPFNSGNYPFETVRDPLRVCNRWLGGFPRTGTSLGEPKVPSIRWQLLDDLAGTVIKAFKPSSLSNTDNATRPDQLPEIATRPSSGTAALPAISGICRGIPKVPA